MSVLCHMFYLSIDEKTDMMIKQKSEGPMFKNIEYASTSHKDKNIDVIHVKPNIAWVIDGANSLFPCHLSNEESDAKWFVKEINEYLRSHIKDFKDANELLRRAQKEVISKFIAMSDEEITDMEFPNAALAFVYAQHNQLYYHVLGPCEIAFHFHDGTIKRVSDLRLPQMDAKLVCLCHKARRVQRVPLYQARAFMDHMMVENRLHRNMEDGYYVFSEDMEAMDKAVSGVVPLDHIQSISLICHGYEAYYHPSRVQQSLEEYLFGKRNQKLVNQYEQALKRQESDSNLARYVQQQVSKPSTFVSFEVMKDEIEVGTPG